MSSVGVCLCVLRVSVEDVIMWEEFRVEQSAVSASDRWD